jgi:hypothetical protein
MKLFFTFDFKALAEEASEDELPSDVDLNDPYFAEEVKKIGKSAHVYNFQLEPKEKDDMLKKIQTKHSFKITRIWIATSLMDYSISSLLSKSVLWGPTIDPIGRGQHSPCT